MCDQLYLTCKYYDLQVYLYYVHLCSMLWNDDNMCPLKSQERVRDWLRIDNLHIYVQVLTSHHLLLNISSPTDETSWLFTKQK